MRWKDEVKQNTSFTPRDTFYVQPGEGACDFYHFEHMIATAQPSDDPRSGHYDLVEQLFKRARGDEPAVDLYHYIDAQVHSPLGVDMIDEIHLSADEIDRHLGGDTYDTANELERDRMRQDSFAFYEGVEKMQKDLRKADGSQMIFVDKAPDWSQP